MVNYANGKIYTIRCRNDDTLIYVGSTTQTLSQRMTQHRSKYKGKKQNCSLFKYIIDDNWSDWYIELYENYPCNDKVELEKREGEIIREIKAINNRRFVGRTNKEYYNDTKEHHVEWNKKNYEKNKEYILQKRKERYEKNKEKLKEKVCCNICGAFSAKYYLLSHQKSKKCMSVLN